MADIRIVDGTEAMGEELARFLRGADAMEGSRCHADEKMAVRYSVHHSLMCRAALVDGDVAAMWGVGGVALGLVGMPWLLTTPVVEQIAVSRFIKIYREQVADMLKLFPVLENYVDAEYAKAIRVLRLCGFIVEEAKSYSWATAPFCRFEARVPWHP